MIGLLAGTDEAGLPPVARPGAVSPCALRSVCAGLAAGRAGVLRPGRAFALVSAKGAAGLLLGLAVWTLSQRFGFMGVGLYPGFVHLDVGPRRAWTRLGA